MCEVSKSKELLLVAVATKCSLATQTLREQVDQLRLIKETEDQKQVPI